MKKTISYILIFCMLIGLLEVNIQAETLDLHDYLVHYYDFNEETNDLMTDKVGENHGMINGCAYEQGISELGLSFDGRDDVVTLGLEDLPVPWTVSVWVNRYNSVEEAVALLDGNSTSLRLEQWNDTNKLGITQYGEGDYCFNYEVPRQVWVNLSFVATGDETKLYVNGEFVDSISTSISLPLMTVGNSLESHGRCPFWGSIDQLKIYNKALNEYEIINGLEGIQPPEIPEEDEDDLSRGNRILLEKGIQTQVWVYTGENDGIAPTLEHWDESNFSTPTYYTGDLYNNEIQQHTMGQWSMGHAPSGQNAVTEMEIQNGHFLTDEQRADLDNLVSMAFADETDYSEGNVLKMKKWFELSHELYPNVIAHTNQYQLVSNTGGINVGLNLNQWSDSQLRELIQVAKPDLLTFDYYYYTEAKNDFFNFQIIGAAINRYRKLALEGHDGTGRKPIPFGQYTQGFYTGTWPNEVGTYKMTEAQVYLVPYMTVAMGGKWLNNFRWIYGGHPFYFFNEDGTTTDIFNYYSNVNRYISNLSDHLVRLNTKDVRVRQGYHKNAIGMTLINKLPDTVEAWDSSADDFIYDIQVTNLGGSNDGGLPGDLLVTYFEPLPSVEQIANSENAEYFMFVNGLVDQAKSGFTSSESTKQTVKVFLNLEGKSEDALKIVNKETGEMETVPLTHIEGANYMFTIDIGGGLGELFVIE